MKIRNDTDRDFHIYGLHLSQGSTIELPAGMKQSKVDFLCRMFTVVKDEQVAVAPVPETVKVTVPVVVAGPEPESEPTTTPTDPVRAKCGAEAPEGHDDPLSWLERHAARCFSCRMRGL